MKHLLLILSAGLAACSPALAPDADTALATQAMKTLSDDAMQGRGVGTDGGKRARAFLVRSVEGLSGTAPELDRFTATLDFRDREPETITGQNIIARVPGRTPGEGPVLEITAHYDHLGVRDGVVYNGADDNASGSGALLAILKSFLENRPEHDVNIVWLDGEERRLSGARHYVKAITDSRPRLNLNLDMISQNADGEIYMAGAHHEPALKPVMERAAQGTGLTLRFGHDRPEDGADDWTLQSDHAAFHARGVPFAYLGVEDHPHYHQPTDDFGTVPLDTYAGAVQLAVNAAHALDDALDSLARPLSPE